MDARAWDERYAASELVWSATPNQFVAAELADLAAGRLTALDGPGMRAQGRWAATALPAHSQLPATAELLRFITTPRATQAMVHGAGVTRGRFKPSVHVTLWS